MATTGGGIYLYQRVLTSILVERHKQLASVAAISVSEVVDGYGRVLEALAGNPDLMSGSVEVRADVLEGAAEALEIFNAGVMVSDLVGNPLTYAPESSPPFGDRVPLGELLEALRQETGPVFSNVLADSRNGQELILVAAPILAENNQITGALIGGVYLRDAQLSEPISRLQVGADGFAYLVDRRGTIIFHPNNDQIGADFSQRPFVARVLAGGSESALLQGQSGEWLLAAVAPVASTGWGLIVQESRASAVAPAQVYILAAIIVALAAAAIVVFFSWQGVRRLVVPIHLLHQQTARLARGEPVEGFSAAGIQEIDALEQAFVQMANQVASYRAGLRRYVDDMTQSIEDERRRIARELHDETTQNLLAIGRRLEYYQGSTVDPERLKSITDIQKLVGDTLKGVRQISQDMRPLVLEDLGLVPALQALVKAVHQADNALPHASFDMCGEPQSLTPAQELALYRVTQEALNNVVKHSKATGAWVELAYKPDLVEISIRDNGCGFIPPSSLIEFTQRGSFGLMGIQERVWALGGNFLLHSSPDKGTHVVVQFPLS